MTKYEAVPANLGGFGVTAWLDEFGRLRRAEIASGLAGPSTTTDVLGYNEALRLDLPAPDEVFAVATFAEADAILRR